MIASPPRVLVVCGLAAAIALPAALPLAARAAAPDAGSAAEAAFALTDSLGQGERFAREVAVLTGVSLTPLLGAAVLSAKAWYQTPEAARDRLPWHKTPAFFIPAFAVILLLWFGHRIPVVDRVAKLVKLYESQLSALLALPFVIKELADATGFLVPSAHAAGLLGTDALAGPSPPGELAGWAIGLFVASTVWLAGHTVNVLALISPFSLVDVLLKTLKMFLVGFLLAATGISPWFGLVVSAVYVFIAARLAGWSFRLMVFGLVFTGDVLLARSASEKVGPGALKGFSAGGLAGVPVRSWGAVFAGPGGLEFRYRPFLVLSLRNVALPARETLVVEDGLVSPSLVIAAPLPGTPGSLVRFPPRYRPHATAVAEVLGGLAKRDAALVRGLEAARRWIREQLADPV